MKAVILIPTLTAGGAERVASILANTWCAYPDTAVTVILMFDDEVFFELDPRIKLVSLRLRPNLRRISRVIAIATALLRFRVMAMRENPTFVLSFMHKYNVFCLAALLWSGISTVVSERDSPTEPNRRLSWMLRWLLYPTANGIIAQTRMGADYVRRKVRARDVTIIHNPIPALQQYYVGQRETLVLSVARLHPKKGHSDLIRAFAKLCRPDWRLVICGDGPLREELEILASSLGVSDRVQFEGRVKDVQSWYRRAGIFALPSHFEGFPNALAEAMVAGVPVVSYDCPTGPAELIQHGKNGYLVRVGDIDGLASHIDDLIAYPERAQQFSEEAAKVVHFLDSDAISKQFFQYCSAVRA